MHTAPRTGAGGELCHDGRAAGETRAALPRRAPDERSARQRRQRLREQLVAWAFIAPVAIYMVVFYAYPLLRNLDLSFRDYTLASFITGEAPWVGIANYIEILGSPTFGPALWNTVVFTFGSIIVQFAIGLALAVFFYRRFPLATTLRALFLVPWLLPLLVSASVWAWMLNSDSGIVNSALAVLGIPQVNWLTSPQWSMTGVLLANIWIGIPFNLVIMYSGLQNIPSEIYEASSLDGANGWQTFWRITFPMLRPVSAITLLLGLVYTLKVFDIIWIMTRGGPGDSSTTFAIWSYRLGFGGGSPDLSPAAAVGNLLILIAFVFGIIYIRTQRSTEDAS
ncbi:sugar ABC transporter permease [Protaetiibacter intestinalis]|uniref:Sugar ABC transporter permease n=2 Tax=Protaetiibacter intestinalis TaxID=2419774 RepID=A0A387BF15_9MICO|nr:sugar ABC transporter permease [Protaetiibacter intestinalis]